MNEECRARVIGTCLDGIRCPVCNGLVYPVPNDGIPGHINYDLYKKNNNCKNTKGINNLGEDFEEEQKRKEPLIQLTLDEYNKLPPKIFHKGEQLKGLINISIDWRTNDDLGEYLPRINMTYIEREGENIYLKTIEYNDVASDI